MTLKTQGVADLVRDVLATHSAPYGEDIIEDVFIAIEQHPQWKQRYDELSADLRTWVVNNWVGKHTKRMTGMQTLREVSAKRTTLTQNYSKLGQ
jgi:hypothetical protein